MSPSTLAVQSVRGADTALFDPLDLPVQPTTPVTPRLLEVHAFGVPRILFAGATRSFVRRKSVALLIYLAATRRAHTREMLADLLWGALPQGNATANLRKVLVELRQQVGGAVIITRESVALNPACLDWFDVAAFELAIARSIAAGDDAALEAALACYHDDFLAGFVLADADAFDEWTLLHREHLRNRLIDALQTLVEIRIERREDQAATAAVMRLLALDPWREEAHRQLMLLLARNGQRSAALAQYEACRRVLADELGVEPMEETAAISRRLRVASVPPPHVLPPINDFFVGRERELRAIASRLANPACRMVTLVGLPGSGKSQLALHAAHTCREANGLFAPAFPGGIYYVPRPTPDPGAGPTAQLLAAVAATVGGVPPAGRPGGSLDAALGGKTLLLVLDDLDVVGGTDAVAQLLTRYPGVTVLATARSPLRLPDEWPLEIAGLPGPPTPAENAGNPAAMLLLHHVQRFGGSAELTETDREAVGRLCRAVDGNPLALILAAQWRTTMSFAAIADHLAHDLDLLETAHPTLSRMSRPVSLH